MHQKNTLHKAVFFDRDGVINVAKILNGRPHPPENLSELVITPSAKEVIYKLKNAGFKIIVITNQPDVARGLVTREQVEEINNYLMSRLSIDIFKVCYHDDVDKCECRKPLPGLIIESAKEYNLDLKHSYVIGDRWKDIAAGEAVGCKTIFIDYKYMEIKPINPGYVIDNLDLVVNIILGKNHGKNQQT
jgi:D-glycero-D-manno-heptose 1,7-bisphosphate phosphatase